jgi:hypothetical protein
MITRPSHITKYDQSDKKKFRAGLKWRAFRKKLKDKQKIDPVTGHKLTKMANCHHKDLYGDYEDLSDESKFVFLNVATHDVVHFFFLRSKPREWRKRILRMIRILKEMEKYAEEYYKL